MLTLRARKLLLDEARKMATTAQKAERKAQAALRRAEVAEETGATWLAEADWLEDWTPRSQKRIYWLLTRNRDRETIWIGKKWDEETVKKKVQEYETKKEQESPRS